MTIQQNAPAWQEAKAAIEVCTDAIWTTEPDDIKLVRWGIIRGGAGTGEQYLSCLVLMETYTLMLGQRLLYSFLLMAKKPELDLATLLIVTRASIDESFHPTVFLADLGLREMHKVGSLYLDALDSLATKEDYIQLTGAFCTYCNRMHRWVHHIFPWNLGLGAFPQRDPAELRQMAALTSELEL